MGFSVTKVEQISSTAPLSPAALPAASSGHSKFSEHVLYPEGIPGAVVDKKSHVLSQIKARRIEE